MRPTMGQVQNKVSQKHANSMIQRLNDSFGEGFAEKGLMGGRAQEHMSNLQLQADDPQAYNRKLYETAQRAQQPKQRTTITTAKQKDRTIHAGPGGPIGAVGVNRINPFS